MRPATTVVMPKLSVIGAVLIVAALAAPALAQTQPAPDVPAGSSRPIEIRVGGTGVASWLSLGGGVRGTVVVPIGDRLSLDLFGGPYWGRENDDFSEDVVAFYGAQLTRRIDRGRRAGFEPFLSFGGEGFIYRDRSYYYFPCYAPGCIPRSETHIRMLPPVMGLVGFGVQKTLSPRLALHVEVQGMVAIVIPAGVRGGVSLTVPLGKPYEMPARRK
jgi:hypothetical protein